MAIYGIGAFYDSVRDVSEQFIERGIACIGWPENDAPALHCLLRHIKAGDLIYIKAHPPGRYLTVKAVGVVLNGEVEDYDLGRGLRVRWVWQRGDHVIHEDSNERYNVRANTIYEEVSPAFQAQIVELLLQGLNVS